MGMLDDMVDYFTKPTGVPLAGAQPSDFISNMFRNASLTGIARGLGQSGEGVLDTTGKILQGQPYDPGKFTYDIFNTLPVASGAGELAGAGLKSLFGRAAEGAATDAAPLSIAGAQTNPQKLVVAMRMPDDSVMYGKPGQVHGDLYNESGFIPNSEDDIGFATPGGPFMDRRTAGDWLAANNPDTAANLARSGPARPWGKLEANDLNVASGDYVNAPPLVGMPTSADIPGMGSVPFGPTPKIRQAALDYMSDQGLPYNPPRRYVPVDPAKAAKVADEFSKMQHNPADPATAASYNALIDETKKQFDAIKKTGLNIEFMKPGMPDPYEASPRLAQLDIANNNHLWVYPTDEGFGPEGSQAAADHPMLADSGVTLDGRQLKNNDLFRIVHDVFGHVKEGVGFRAAGEDNAFRQHRAMYTPLAQKALATETRGQNSWLNYGPYGDLNRTAKTANTVFADQKAGLLPDWAALYANGKGAAPLSLAGLIKRDTGSTLKSLSLSPQETTLANRMMKSGMSGDAIIQSLGERLKQQPEPLDYPIPFGMDPPQTVYNPVGNENPAIYGDPREIAAAAAQNVATESPWLKRLFGVTRDDLYGIGQQGTRPGNMDPVFNASAGTSPQAQKVMTPWNAQRLVDTLSEAGKYPNLIKGMDSWYVMDPVYQRLKELVGPEEAKAQYNQFNAFSGMASPGSPVDWEINRGGVARYLHNQDRFEEFPSWGSIAREDRPDFFPADLHDMIPHAYTTKAHVPAMRKYIAGGKVDMDSAKVPLYIQASGVPETGFQTTMPVADAHFTKAVGLPDVRDAIKTKNAAMKPGVYTPIGHWYRENVASPLGIEAVPAQARQWGTFAHLTGVDTKIGAPKLELLAHRIGETATRRGVSPEWLRDQVLLGKEYAANHPGAAPFSFALNASQQQ